jgi:hypothetical protein
VTLTVADIDRWDPEAVREVCHAAKTRAVIAQEAGDGLARLPAFRDWDGQTALAARDAIGNTALISTPTVRKRWPWRAPPTWPPTESKMCANA